MLKFSKTISTMFLFGQDPSRKQRLPFLVSRDRLEAALNQLTRPACEGGHEAFQSNRLVPNGRVQVNLKNMEEYNKNEGEPPGLDVVELDQQSGWTVDNTLLNKWLSSNHPLQLNVAFQAYFTETLDECLPPPDEEF
jgi:hypothetical protein